MVAAVIPNTLSLARTTLLVALVANMLVASSVQAAPANPCHGTKRWYDGQCRYPDDIARIEEEKRQQQRWAEQQRREGEEKRQAEEKRQRALEQQAKDRERCDRAREVDTIAAWEAYKASFAKGMCSVEAGVRIAELREAQRVKPSPPSQPDATQATQSTTGTPPPTETLAGAAHQAEDESSPNVPLTLGWVSVGLAGAGLGLGIGFATSALNARADFDELKSTDEVAAEQAADDSESAALVADISFVAAAFSGAVGVVLLIVAYNDDEPETAQRIPVLAPLVGPTVGGVAVDWAF